jgi:hypothetical protein
MTHDYDQLCGALGLLKQNGVDLPWEGLNTTLKDIGRGLGQYRDTDIALFNATNERARTMLKVFRMMCLQKKLIGVGELFNEYDCVPLV